MSPPHRDAPTRPTAGSPSGTAGVEGYDRQKSVGFLLRKAYQRNMMLFQKLCIDPQLTSVQLAALHALAENGACSLTALGRHAAMDPATTSGVVDRLGDRGLVTLAQDETDRRKVIVHLAPPGRRIVEDMIPVLVRVADATMDRLNVSERIALIYLLSKMTEPEEDVRS